MASIHSSDVASYGAAAGHLLHCREARWTGATAQHDLRLGPEAQGSSKEQNGGAGDLAGHRTEWRNLRSGLTITPDSWH